MIELVIVLALVIVALVAYVMHVLNTYNDRCPIVSRSCPREKPVIQYIEVCKREPTPPPRISKISQLSELSDLPIDPPQQILMVNPVERDYRVLRDELYPPYNRDNVPTGFIKPVATRPGSSDTYRLAGYLVDEENRNDTWRLFAREKYKGGNAEWYASPANNNVDVKVFLDSKTVLGQKFGDIYNVPDEVRVNHPMFERNTTYKVVSLPMSDLSSPYY